jgi:hypothetical protein
LKKRYFGDWGFWDWAQSPIPIKNIFKKLKIKSIELVLYNN